MTASAIGQSGVSAFKWSAVSTVLRFALQLGAQVILARTLGPEIFGIFAIGMVVLTFANFVSSFGFSWSLLQRAEVTNEDIRFAWTWQCTVGLITMVALYFLAPFLAVSFREPRAEPVIAWLSIACLLNAAAGPATYLLQRDLNFRAVGLVQVSSYALGYIAVGVPLALSGWGAMALVAAWLVQALAQFAGSYALKRHAIKPLFWYFGASNAIGTGRAVFLTNIVNWILNNLDRILVARLLNATSLGLYNVAYNLATLPNTLLLGALQPAFLAAGARLQNEVQRLASAYIQILATILVLGVPMFVFLGLISPDVIAFLYGARWNSAGWVLAILFFAMPAYVIWGISTPVLWNTQRKNHEFALQLPIIGVGLIAFYSLAGRGIYYAAGVASSLLVLRAVVIGASAFKALNIKFTTVLPDAVRGFVLALVCGTAVVISQRTVAIFEMPVLSLLVASLINLFLFVMIILYRPQLLGEHTLSMIVRFVPALKTRFSSSSSIIRSVDSLNEQRL